jgi:hypothetical protein
MFRASVVVVTLVGWFLISNHCALTGLESWQSGAAHASCHANTPAPSKLPAKGDQMPCCKLLPATVVKDGASVVQNGLTFSLQPYFVGFIAFPEQLHWSQSFELDTGPPFSESFAESVLQRSVLAHAPPFVLS